MLTFYQKEAHLHKLWRLIWGVSLGNIYMKSKSPEEIWRINDKYDNIEWIMININDEKSNRIRKDNEYTNTVDTVGCCDEASMKPS